MVGVKLSNPAKTAPLIDPEPDPNVIVCLFRRRRALFASIQLEYSLQQSLNSLLRRTSRGRRIGYVGVSSHALVPVSKWHSCLSIDDGAKRFFFQRAMRRLCILYDGGDHR